MLVFIFCKEDIFHLSKIADMAVLSGACFNNVNLLNYILHHMHNTEISLNASGKNFIHLPKTWVFYLFSCWRQTHQQQSIRFLLTLLNTIKVIYSCWISKRNTYLQLTLRKIKSRSLKSGDYFYIQECMS